ncbi:MAG: cytidine deaminase [Firmicutes bacterium]|nr:cytidine deaminase [Bacillota bacterium]
MTSLELVNLAIEAREHAYVPYSNFAVGAALLMRDGKVYQGCNIENSSYGATNCAERTAFFTAVYQGERDFEAIAIVGGKAGEPVSELCAPCGICRQVMREFCKDDFKIILSKGDGTVLETTLTNLLPLSFSKEDLER